MDDWHDLNIIYIVVFGESPWFERVYSFPICAVQVGEGGEGVLNSDNFALDFSRVFHILRWWGIFSEGLIWWHCERMMISLTKGRQR